MEFLESTSDWTDLAVKPHLPAGWKDAVACITYKGRIYEITDHGNGTHTTRPASAETCAKETLPTPDERDMGNPHTTDGHERAQAPHRHDRARRGRTGPRL